VLTRQLAASKTEAGAARWVEGLSKHPHAEVAAPEQHRRFGVFLDAYGIGPPRAEVVAAILHRQDLLDAQGQRLNTAMARWADRYRASPAREGSCLSSWARSRSSLSTRFPSEKM
jgi:hypothetical protein